MLKMVKLRILNGYLPSVRGLEDDDLTRVLRDDADKLTARERVLAAVNASDPEFARGELKAIILAVLLEEETHLLPENRLDEKVIGFEQSLVERAKSLDLTELRKDDPDRWHHFDTYRIVLEAAWSDDGTISPDEARLLGVLRRHLSISREEHWLLNTLIKRFPKDGCGLHSADEVNEARKELQRQGVLWQHRDDDNQNVDVIPAEIAETLRREYAGQELQSANCRRLLSHDAVLLGDLRAALERHGLDRYGNKAELIERMVAGEMRPSEVLSCLDKEKLSTMCAGFGLRSCAKAELVSRLVEFYDDLTFELRPGTKDEREAWYADYDLLAARSYAELRAKKVIARDLEIQSLFEEGDGVPVPVPAAGAVRPGAQGEPDRRSAVSGPERVHPVGLQVGRGGEPAGLPGRAIRRLPAQGAGGGRAAAGVLGDRSGVHRAVGPAGQQVQGED
jgi:hypothetical protein